MNVAHEPEVAEAATPFTWAIATAPEEAAGAGGAPLGLMGGAGTRFAPHELTVLAVCVPPYVAADWAP